MTQAINLALQGGGAHGAFTWGVLDRLLEEDDIEIEGITATSAGAMNAAALKHGFVLGDGRSGGHWKDDFIFEDDEIYFGDLIGIMDPTLPSGVIGQITAADLRVLEEEHHAPLGVLQKTADALPGFGIVAAVLGIVITMGAIDGPVEEIGHKVGAALVGTFLGILMSYGFFGPLVSRMEFLGAAEMAFFRTINTVILAFVNDVPPKVAIEQARRGMASEVKLSREELDQLFKEVDAAAA